LAFVASAKNGPATHPLSPFDPHFAEIFRASPGSPTYTASTPKFPNPKSPMKSSLCPSSGPFTLVITTPSGGLVLLLAALITLAPLPQASAQLGPGKLVAKRLVTGLARPVFVTSPPGDTNRLFIVEKRFSTGNTGRIRIFDKSTDTLLATPFLSIPGVNTGNEEGLLGLAFHPDYATNGLLYVFFSDDVSTNRTTRIVEYQASTLPYSTATTAGVVREIMQIPLPNANSNHNGGWLGFHPLATGAAKTYLYISVGDGGGGNDNATGHTDLIGNGQDKASLLGKILRIDVTGDAFPGNANNNYTIPLTNPLVGDGGGVREEIWAYGLRNPWRCGFDSQTGDFYIADVGQNAREEIDVQPALAFSGGTPVAPNYGWRLREGEIATPTPTGSPVGGAPPADQGEPLLDYPAGSPPSGTDETESTTNGGEFRGDSISGGAVYRGAIQWLQGLYFVSDFVSTGFWSLRYNTGTSTVSETIQWSGTPGASIFAVDPPSATFNNYASISEAADGELYICTQPQNGGSGNDTAGTVFVLTQDPFFLYRSSHYTLAELNNDAISGIAADSDKDGKTTIEEFVVNTDPTVPDSPLPLGTSVAPDGGADEFLTMTLTIDPDAADSVDIVGETSPDLTIGNFSAATATTTVSGGSAIARDLVPLSTINSKRFGRFKFELK
jgi:glucose/arabinose dehydrogenase